MIRDEEILNPASPTVLDEGGADPVNLTESNSDSDDGGKESEVNQRSEDASADIHELDANIQDESRGVDFVENGEAVKGNTNTETDGQLKDENTEKYFEEVLKTSFSAPVVLTSLSDRMGSDEDSPINRIHSEILELTRRISQPEAGLLNLIRATEEAENEAKRQQELAAAASPSRESLLLRAMAEHGATDFSIQGALRGLSSRDPKLLTSTSPIAPKTPAPINKTKLQSDDRGKPAVTEKESLSTSPRKDRGVMLNSEISAHAESNIKPQTAELPQAAGKGTETRRSEVAETDMLGTVIIHCR